MVMIMKTIDDVYAIRRNKYHIENLSNTQTFVPFVGAGMSSDIYPLWRDLFEQFNLLPNEKIILNQYLSVGRFEEAASYIYSISKGLFIDTVKDIFSPSRLIGKNFSPALKILPQITDDMIITTNIDEVIETVWKNSGCVFDSIITPDFEDQFNRAITNKDKILIKLHGTVNESSKYVLTKEQYDKCYGVNSNDTIDFTKPFPRDLGRAMQSKTILFLGCSLKNDRVLHILKQIAGWNEYIKHYALLSLSDNDDENTLRERELEKYGIFPIWFPKEDYSYIAIILEELSHLKKNK